MWGLAPQKNSETTSRSLLVSSSDTYLLNSCSGVYLCANHGHHLSLGKKYITREIYRTSTFSCYLHPFCPLLTWKIMRWCHYEHQLNQPNSCWMDSRNVLTVRWSCSQGACSQASNLNIPHWHNRRNFPLPVLKFSHLDITGSEFLQLFSCCHQIFI